jgi:hypothetical protein
MRIGRFGASLSAGLAALILAGATAAASSAPARRASTDEWVRVGRDRYARIDWDRVARIDVRPSFSIPNPPMLEINSLYGNRLRQVALITWPETIREVQRRFASEPDRWVLLGRGTVAPTASMTQYVNLDQVNYVHVLPGTPLAGDEIVTLYAVGRRGTRILLGQVFRRVEVQKVRRMFAEAFR